MSSEYHCYLMPEDFLLRENGNLKASEGQGGREGERESNATSTHDPSFPKRNET